MADRVQKVVEGAGDVAAVVVTVGTLSQILPSVAAIFTIIWTAIRIFEMKTVQNIIKGISRRCKKS